MLTLFKSKFSITENFGHFPNDKSWANTFWQMKITIKHRVIIIGMLCFFTNWYSKFRCCHKSTFSSISALCYLGMLLLFSIDQSNFVWLLYTIFPYKNVRCFLLCSVHTLSVVIRYWIVHLESHLLPLAKIGGFAAIFARSDSPVAKTITLIWLPRCPVGLENFLNGKFYYA